jgi:NTE family protein
LGGFFVYQELRKMSYKNLVFEGGGIKAIAYAGVLKVLGDKGILEGIEKVAGTSAGAITACLLALNYTPDEIYKIVFDMNFSKLQDNKNYMRVLEKYGIYEGAYFLLWIKSLIKKKAGNENITFSQLKELGFKDLYTITTNLNTEGIQIFSAEITPNVIVAEAVRASMSIPIFFEAFKFSQGIDTTCSYVDGGMLWNFPLDIFDSNNELCQETLGIALWNYNQLGTSNELKHWESVHYIKLLFETLLSSQSCELSATTVNDFRIIKIDDFGISATNFGLSPADKLKLYNSGILYTEKFIV